MVHAMAQAGSKVRVQNVSLAGFDRLFEMKQQFSKGSFSCISAAVSIVEWKMVTIKKLRGVLRNPLVEITEFKMLQAMRGVSSSRRPIGKKMKEAPLCFSIVGKSASFDFRTRFYVQKIGKANAKKHGHFLEILL